MHKASLQPFMEVKPTYKNISNYTIRAGLLLLVCIEPVYGVDTVMARLHVSENVIWSWNGKRLYLVLSGVDRRHCRKMYRTSIQEPVSSVSLSRYPCELFLCRNISWVRRMNGISLHKSNEPDLQTRILHILGILFLLYYFYFGCY